MYQQNNITQQLSLTDVAIVTAYFLAVLSIGYYHSKKNRNSEDYINGNRQLPWLAVLGSLVATEVSASTFLATPGVGFSENMNYLQMGIGSVFARIFIAWFFLGAFYSFNSLTIYDYLGQRFGNKTRYCSSILFILSRLLASSVRLMIAATGLSLILHWPFVACLTTLTVIAIIYTGNGGIRSIIWTDVLQAIVFIACGITVLIYIINSISFSTIMELGTAENRFEIIRLSNQSTSLDNARWFNDPTLLYIAVLFGFLSTTAAFGTDQDLTQRMLTCKDVNYARRSVVLSGVISLPIAALFLFIGISLFAYYQVHSGTNLPVGADKVFPWFIGNELPSGLRGLLLVGVLAAAMSSLDSAMGALSSSALVDLYRPLVKSTISIKNDLWVSRALTITFGVILAIIAFLLKDAEGFLWLTFKIGSVTYGSLLGIFLLGILSRSGSDSGNWIGMLSGAILCGFLLIMIEKEIVSLGWTWLILIGAAWTFFFSYYWPQKKLYETDRKAW